MRADILFSPALLLWIAALLTLVVLILWSMLMGQNFTRPVVVVIGLALVAIATAAYLSVLALDSTGKALLAEHLLSQHVFTQFQHYSAAFQYAFPFVTASVGVAAISDAVVNGQKYANHKFSFVQFLKDVCSFIFLPVGLVLACLAAVVWVVCAPVAPARRYIGRTAPGIWRWVQLTALKVVIIGRHTCLYKKF